MSKFCEDELVWAKYFPKSNASQSDDDLRLKVWEWYEDPSLTPDELTLESADTLISRDLDAKCPLRIVSAPLNAEFVTQLRALKKIFQHYSFPSAILSELLASVTNSFGTTPVEPETGVSVAWSYFLCKDIPVRFDGEGEEVGVDDNRRLRDSHYPENWRWKVCHFVVHTREEPGKPKCVTLLCFGAPRTMIERFRRLIRNKSWRDAVEDPYTLFSIVYEELYNTVDKFGWQLAVMFRPVERGTLDRARTNDSVDQNNIDFTNMHNISKHCIYMIEAVEAAILTLDDMVAYLARTRPASDAMITALTYRKSTFKSTRLRLGSLEKRMANIISLSFNLVTQQDSRVMQNDSSAMKVIAVMTLIFLPATGIASVFSMPFFHVDFGRPNGNRMLNVASSFWIFWVVAIPLTVMIFVAWYWIYRESKKRRGAIATKHRSWLRRFVDRDPEMTQAEYPSKIHKAPQSYS